MTDALTPAAEAAPVIGQPQGYDPKAAMLSVGTSLLLNGVLPFALYKILVPHFPANSVMPLLYASAFPVLGLAISLIRTRVIDAIAIFALFGIAYSIATTVLAGEIRLALILGSTQGFLIAGAFFVSALMGRPIVFYIVRQFAAGNDPERRARFAAVDRADGGRTLYIATMVWAVGTAALSAVALTLAFTLPPATYILVNNIVNTAVNIALVVWTSRFVRTRLMRVGERLMAAAAA
ncbi:MAG TPA: VC0807 family protein [Rhizomicrobium sp.]|jgi:hypothetical protein